MKIKIGERIKLWWKSTPLDRKLGLLFNGIAATASVAGAVYAVNEVRDLKVEVKLYPNGKDDPNPVELTPDSRTVTEQETDISKQHFSPLRRDPAESRDHFQQAAELFNTLMGVDDDVLGEDELEDAREKALELAWDLAAIEDRLDDAYEMIPTQVHD